MINLQLPHSTILVTGGTGSFGGIVVKTLLKYKVKEVRVFSRDELKQSEMRDFYSSNRLKFIIGDIRNYHSVYQATQGVDFIFHAAALKQVPSCEFFPMEAIKTNIIGSENIINAAQACEVKKLVMLSTDKAVHPINAMGLTKALMEKLMVAKARNLHNTNTIICATRYGNVMASRGSVIPLFVSQIKKGREITITDPSMTRFMMSLDESVKLVFQAFEKGENGDILVQSSPACTIENLVIALKELFNASNPLKIIGTRHGEKLYESLISREEMRRSKKIGKYYKIPSDVRDLNYNNFINEGNNFSSDIMEYTSHSAQQLKVSEIKNLLLNIEYIKAELNI